MSVKKIQDNVVRFTDTNMVLCSLFLIFGIPGLVIFKLEEFNLKPGGMIFLIIITFFFTTLDFIWWRQEKQGVILDLDQQVLKCKPSYFSALFNKKTYTKPFDELEHQAISFHEITSISNDVDVRVSSDNKITANYKLNITGAFGAKVISFHSRETAQSFYQMLIAACNLE